MIFCTYYNYYTMKLFSTHEYILAYGLRGCNRQWFAQRRSLYVNNGDIVQTTLLLTKINKRISQWMSVLISQRCISYVYVVQTVSGCNHPDVS